MVNTTQKKQTISRIILILILILNILVPITTTATNFTNARFIIENITYTMTSGLSFHKIVADTDYIGFNNLNISIDSTNTMAITINNVTNTIASTGVNETLLNFTATTIGGIVWFNFSGLTENYYYDLLVDGGSRMRSQANSSGGTNFSYNSWSTHTFLLRGGGYPVSIYNYSKAITIDHTKIGAGGVTNFPILINITDADIKQIASGGHVSSSNGYDIAFYDVTQTQQLSHQIEYYNPATGYYVAWVNVSSLSSSVDTTIWMFYGNDTIIVDPSSSATWDTYYYGVWHSNEASGDIIDSTGTQDGSSIEGDGAYGVPSYSQTGLIKNSIYLPGTVAGTNTKGPAFDITNNAYKFYSEDIILEAVVKIPENRNYYETIICFGDHADMYPEIRIHKIRSGYAGDPPTYDQANNIACEQNYWAHRPLLTSYSDWVWSDSDIDTSWHLITAKFSRTENETAIYVDGVKQSKTQYCNITRLSNVTTSFVSYIGRASLAGSTSMFNKYSKMYFDEIRISKNTSRSDAWHTTTYNTIFGPSTFMSFGPEINMTGAPASFTVSNVFPTNGTRIVSLIPTCSVDIVENNGYSFNITLWENSTGGMVAQTNLVNQVDGTFTFDYLNATSLSTKYYWNMTLVNGSTSLNYSYSFITPNASYNTFVNASFTGEVLVNTNTIYRIGVPYTTMHDASTGTLYSAYVTVTNRFSAGQYYIYRGLLYFDTSSIPDNAQVQSCSVRLTRFSDTNGVPWIVLMDNSTSYPSRPSYPPESSDYYYGYYTKDIGSRSGAAWNAEDVSRNITLNVTGLGAINRTGMSSFIVRTQKEILGVDDANEWMYFVTPKLYVNYSYSVFYPITNSTTDIETNTAILHGQVIGDDNTLCSFGYNLSRVNSSNPGNIVTSSGTYDDGESFSYSLTGLVPASHYYTRARAISSLYGISWAANQKEFLTRPYPPSVITVSTQHNNITIYWTNATVGTNVNHSVMVRYSNTGYPTSITDGILLENNSATNNATLIGYTPDTPYYFSLWSFANISESSTSVLQQWSSAYNTTSIITGSYPTNLAIVWKNNTRIKLTWTPGTGDTVVVRNTTHFPQTPFNGTEIYNGSGSTVTDTGLDNMTKYYYRAWTWTGLVFGDGNSSVSGYTAPQSPQHVEAQAHNYTAINISWWNGTGANTTIVMRKTGGYPTSITDGTMIYNGTVNYTWSSPIATNYYYALFSHNKTLNLLSPGVNLSWSVVWINAYDANTLVNLSGYSVFMTNNDGSQTFERTGCTNPTVVNISDIPQGVNILRRVSKSGYHDAVYYETIAITSMYYLDAYLIPVETEGEVPNGTGQDCVLVTAVDTIGVSDYTKNAVVELQHAFEDIISVEQYNSSLYGTYGGWIVVPSNNYTTNSTNVTVRFDALWKNTTMIRVTYTYYLCTGLTSALYNIRVVETIQTDFTDFDRGVSGVNVVVKKYISGTGEYLSIGSLVTNANGYCSIFLAWNDSYLVLLNKTGYINSSDYLNVQPPNEYGQTTEQIFRLVRIYGDIDLLPDYNPLEIITIGVWCDRSTHILQINYTDSLCQTIDVTITVYVLNGSTNLSTLWYNRVITNNCSFQTNFSNINNSNRYTIVVHYNHSLFGCLPGTYTIEALFGWLALHLYTSKGWTNNLWTANYGTNPLGWSNCIMFIIMICGLFFGGWEELPLVLIALGVIFEFVNYGIGFFTWETAAAATIIPLLFIISGILTGWHKYRG